MPCLPSRRKSNRRLSNRLCFNICPRMKIREITDVIEAFAPLSAQESYDNSGLIVGDPDSEVENALLCVDITEPVLEEAIDRGIGLVISHHPVVFHPLKRLVGSSYIERVVARAIREGVALYACHTNLDSVPGGMSYRLAGMLGVEGLRLLSHSKSEDPRIGFGVVGELPREVAVVDFLSMMKKRLGLRVIRHSELCRETVCRVALCTGAGASLIPAAKAVGADIYIAADFKYNDFLDADGRLIVADVGHFESEYCAIDLLYDIITKKMPTFALRKSAKSQNPINYFV